MARICTLCSPQTDDGSFKRGGQMERQWRTRCGIVILINNHVYGQRVLEQGQARHGALEDAHLRAWV